jgi:glycosyltransferase involved in cell wall biosynthesis
MLQPLVSIGLPVFNGENFLDSTLHAIRAQTFEDFELIISDNASTDRSLEIAQAHAETDDRIRVSREERTVPPSDNFARVLEMARGRLFKWSAHDDLIAPEFIDRCVSAMRSTEGAVVACPRSVFIDAGGALLSDLPSPPFKRYSWFSDEILDRARGSIFAGYCHPIFGLIDTDTLRSIPRMGAYPNADGVMLLELALRGVFVEIPEPLLLIRRHEGQSTALSRGRGGPRAYAPWWTAGMSRGARLPHWRMSIERALVIRRASLTPQNQLGAIVILSSWMWKHRDELTLDLVVALKESLNLLKPGYTSSTEGL